MLKEISTLAKNYNSLEEVVKEIRNVQSIKSRLKKEKFKANYETEMEKVVSLEQALKEVREYFEPKKTTVTTMTQNEVDVLTLAETYKAIASIQSKKCRSQYTTESLESNSEYQLCLRIEEMLLKHKQQLQTSDIVTVSSLQMYIEHLKSLDAITIDKVIEDLQKLIDKE